MGRRGPKPEAAILKLVKGNPGKRRIKKNEPQLPPPAPESSVPPKRLKGVAAEEWNKLYDGLVAKGVVHVGNLTIFENYCYVLGKLRTCENVAEKVSIEIAIMKGYLKAAAVLRQQLRQLARDLNLTVYAGEKTGGGQETESPLSKYLQRA
jgi:phage terminase small subunit